MGDVNEIYDRMMRSKEREIKFKLWMFKNNVSICDENFRELIKFNDTVNKNLNEIRKKKRLSKTH